MNADAAQMNARNGTEGFVPSMIAATYTRALLRSSALHLRSSAFSALFLPLLLTLPSLAAAEVTAKDAWVRGTVAAQRSSGAFVTLTSTTDAKLVGAKSPVAKIVEIHESKMHNGVNHMNAVDAVDLPAGKPVALKPGGHHVMLMGLTKPLNPGDVVPIVFTIEEKGKRSELAVKAEVRALGSR